MLSDNKLFILIFVVVIILIMTVILTFYFKEKFTPLQTSCPPCVQKACPPCVEKICPVQKACPPCVQNVCPVQKACPPCKNLIQENLEGDDYCSDPNNVISKSVKCKNVYCPPGKCNTFLTDFFDGVVDESYLWGPLYNQAALVIAEYRGNKVVPVLPFKYFQKVLNAKLNIKMKDKLLGYPKLSVFVGQKAIMSTEMKTKIGLFNPLTPLQVYHSGLFFVEASKYEDSRPNVKPQDILFCLELWGEGKGKLAAGSCMYPDENKDSQDKNKIVIEYPEAFGCEADGGYWKDSWDETWYLGDAEYKDIEKLYNASINWLTHNWGYTGVTLISQPCDVDKIHHEIDTFSETDAVLSSTCSSYIQAMCIFLENNTNGSLTNLLSKVPWTDMQLVIDKVDVVDLESPAVKKDIADYIQKLNKLFGVEENVKNDNLTFNPFNKFNPFENPFSNFMKNIKQKIHDHFNVPDEKQNLLSKSVFNVLLGSFIIPMVVYFMLNEFHFGAPYLYISSFDNTYDNTFVDKDAEIGRFILRKVYLKLPSSFKNVYSTCPGFLYENYNPYNPKMYIKDYTNKRLEEFQI